MVWVGIIRIRWEGFKKLYEILAVADVQLEYFNNMLHEVGGIV